MMLTRCPTCQTAFRLHPEQLRARRGEVRCGSCLTPFNALEHLTEDARTPASAVPPPHTESADTPGAAPAPSSEALAAPTVSIPLPQTESPAFRPPPKAFPEKHQTSAAKTFQPLRTGSAASGQTAPVARKSPLPSHHGPSPIPPPPDTTAPALSSPADREHEAAEENLPEPPRPLSTHDEAAISGPVIAPDTDELDRLNTAYGAPAPSRGRRIAWGLAVLLLAVLLAAQTVYLFRQDIARELPGLRPLLEKACAYAGCALPLPRDAGLIDIPSSDLQSEPGKAGRYVLYATVRNRASYAQTWPHLELTLTDAGDRPLSRRILEPQDWVTPEKLADSFPARGDTAVRLAFDASGLTPTGYRIYVFYP